MAEQLFIRLPSTQEQPIYWLVWSSAEKEIIASGELTGAEQLSLLTDKASKRNVVVLTDSQNITLKQLNVPAKSKKAIHQAVPYMLEDDLAQEVDSLFFAYGTHTTDKSNCSVAIVERSQMQTWLAWLAEASIEANYMIPDILAMPQADNQWQSIAINNTILLRTGKWSGYSIDRSIWAFLLPKLIATEADSDEPIEIANYSPLPELVDGVNVVEQPEELPLALLAMNVDVKAFNLLQGEFKLKTERAPWVKSWAWAAGIAVTAILLNVAYKGIHLMQLNDQITQTEQQIVASYKKAFPQTQRIRITTIRSQLKRKLAGIGGNSQQADFLHMLEQMQPAFAQATSIKPESLRYDSKRNEMRMQASAKDYQAFEKFQNALKQRQLETSQGALNSQGNSVTGSISIKMNNGGRS
ncbi:type II secretion system protein GspL [Thalassotalea marina]|uniref:Type II secretion system protein L n=1 Tax=Thalassotalea marina TaxID=1673741 RepID=A0A919ENB3_9GAMM|nr:type II secretion system protein GspL [Thalassotalea marina]GHG03940.1 type II secretion system protein L [Thalassotalea marina]